MKSFKLKNVIFNPTEIVLIRRKDNIIIDVNDIEKIRYIRASLINYLISPTWFGGTYPNRLQIHMNKKIGKTKLYLVRMKYKEFLELPSIYREKIDSIGK